MSAGYFGKGSNIIASVLKSNRKSEGSKLDLVSPNHMIDDHHVRILSVSHNGVSTKALDVCE